MEISSEVQMIHSLTKIPQKKIFEMFIDAQPNKEYYENFM